MRIAALALSACAGAAPRLPSPSRRPRAARLPPSRPTGVPRRAVPLYGIVRVDRARVLAACRPRRTCVVDPRTGGTVKVIRGTSLLMLLAR
jgi:hypothetical protein